MSFLLSQGGQALLSMSVLAVCLTLATASDLKSRRIPNRLIVAGMAAAAALHALGMLGPGAGLAGSRVWSPLWGAAVGAGVLLPLYGLRGMGAGDVKLMALIGAFVGAWHALWAALLALVAGGFVCAGVALWVTLRSSPPGGLRRNLPRVAYAPVLSLGVALSGWRLGLAPN